MTSYFDSLRAASFRGVMFDVSTRTLKGGRRIVQHSYPQRDAVGSEDMGREARTFTVKAFLVGAGWMLRRDALIKAFEQGGPGDYIDPWGRKQRVVLTSYSLEENMGQGGHCTFDLSFVEAAEQHRHTVLTDTAGVSTSTATTASTAILSDFSALFDTSKANALVQDAQATLFGLCDTINGLSAASGVIAGINSLKASLYGLLVAPADLASAVLDLIGTLGNSVDIADRYRALGRLAGFQAQSVGSASVGWVAPATSSQIAAARQNAATGTTTNTSVSEAVAVNRAALTTLVQDAVLIEQAKCSAAMTFESYDDAVAIRDALISGLETRMSTADDEVYRAFDSLRTAIVADIAARGLYLERLTTLTLPTSLPALALAWRLYGDATRDEELIARNSRLICHPGFVPGGVPLKVLNHA